MPDKGNFYPPFFFGIGMNLGDYSIIDVLKWLTVVGAFYIIIVSVNGYYKEMAYNAQIIRYGSYRRWMFRYLFTLGIACFLLSMFDYIIFALNYEFLLCICTAFNMTASFIFKGVCLFHISNRKNYNFWVCIFFVFEIGSVYYHEWSRWNPFAWSMACRADVITAQGFNIYIAVAFEIIAIFCVFILRTKKGTVTYKK